MVVIINYLRVIFLKIYIFYIKCLDIFVILYYNIHKAGIEIEIDIEIEIEIIEIEIIEIEIEIDIDIDIPAYVCCLSFKIILNIIKCT